MREPIPPQSISESEFDALEGMARALTASGLYRVIRRFRPRRRYAEEDGAPKKHALFIDLETTGLDHGADAIIEFCGVPFEYGPADGRIYGVGEPVVYLEDP
jgi:DNA polymerase III subunit epsilon